MDNVLKDKVADAERQGFDRDAYMMDICHHTSTWMCRILPCSGVRSSAAVNLLQIQVEPWLAEKDASCRRLI